MGKFAVVASYDMAPDQIDVFLPALRAHRDRCLENEPGTLQFDILRTADKLMLYELYTDEAAFQAHRNGSSGARLREETTAVKRELHLVTCTVLD